MWSRYQSSVCLIQTPWVCLWEEESELTVQRRRCWILHSQQRGFLWLNNPPADWGLWPDISCCLLRSKTTSPIRTRGWERRYNFSRLDCFHRKMRRLREHKTVWRYSLWAATRETNWWFQRVRVSPETRLKVVNLSQSSCSSALPLKLISPALINWGQVAV